MSIRTAETDYVHNILSVFLRASDAEFDSGMHWVGVAVRIDIGTTTV